MRAATSFFLPPMPALRAAWRDVWAEEWPAWLYAARTVLAMLTALAIAFRLDLSSPSSAAVTVAVVSMPQAGMALEKSFYRLLATLCGGIAALLFVMMFAQQRDWFIGALALWVGACATGSSWYRNFQSYGWALAGYTACIVGFPAYDHALQAFDITVDRISIVALGVLCAGVINATVFPRSSVPPLVQSVRHSFRDFVGFARTALQGYGARAELHATQRQFLHDIVALESGRVSSFFEDPDSRIRTPRLRRFISQFMAASTTAHAVNRLRDDMQTRGLHDVIVALAPLHDEFLRALHTADVAPPTSAAVAPIVVTQLDALLAAWETHALAAHARLACGIVDARHAELDGALLILREFVGEARDFAETYAQLGAARSALDRLASAAPVARADVGTALIAGVRTALTFIVVCCFWIVSAWPDGFLAVLMGAVVCTLFASAATPTPAIWTMAKGFAAGLVAAVLCFSLVLPALDGLLLLAVGLTPFLLLGTYLMGKPNSAGFGSGFCMMFLVSLTITETMHYDIVAMLNAGIAQVIGVVIAALAFTVLFPTHTRWHSRRIEKTLWAELRLARHSPVNKSPLPDLRHRFESGARDLTLQFINVATNDTERQRRAIAGMVLLEAGRAVIALRLQLQRMAQEAALKPYVAAVSALLNDSVDAFAVDQPARSFARLRALAQRIAVLDAELADTAAPTAALRNALRLLALAASERQMQWQGDDQLSAGPLPVNETEVRDAA